MLIKIFRKLYRYNILILFLIFLITLTYSFLLANKRYINFEYGKFDLGNMSQIVWNTSQGRFMEVTDQFGTNMPRWGMSHVDPILILFVPIYWVYDNPMILILIQHIFILSAIFPLFLLSKKKLKSSLIGYLIVLTYILYPAIGFTLVWTGFHGISFVAPLLVWIVWILEKDDFKSSKLYWILIIAMLLGKEEIGAILALGSVFLYFKNKKLAVKTFLISFSWFIFAFFIVIPHYANLRESSISNFAQKTGVFDLDTDQAGGDNFFFQRYEYLGSSYSEMLKTFLTRPDKVLKVSTTKDKITALNNLLGPLGYIAILNPFWLVTTPDLAIVLLSKDDIFDISNHRIGLVISGLFISYLYLLAFMKKREKSATLTKGFAFVVLFLTLFFSNSTNNPLYVSGKSLITNKFIFKIFPALANEIKITKEYQIGESRLSKVPSNNPKCLNEMVHIINELNPKIYTGPDYLGAHAANREVNALFPARFWDADLVIADIFETKTVNPLGSTGWTFNKEGLRRLVDSQNYVHKYSCGRISAFEKGNSLDSSQFIKDSSSNLVWYDFGTDKISLQISVKKLDSHQLDIFIQKKEGSFLDKTTFWTFENVSDSSIKFSFINYISVAFRESLDRAHADQIIEEIYHPKLVSNLPSGDYKVFYGVGDLLNAQEVYIGEIKIL